ncbi:MAG: leucyl aminopeptidase [Candidatus Thermoplasmatota archaeon]
MAKAKSSPRPESRTVTVSVEHGDITQVDAELLVVDAFEGVERLRGVSAKVDAATGGALARVLAAGDFKGKFKETALVHPAQGKAKRVLLVGMGKLDKLTPDRVRRVAAVIARRARDLGVERVHTVLHGARRDGSGVKPRVAAEALAEGALLGLYLFEHYKGERSGEDKKKEAEQRKLKHIVIVEKNAASARQAREGAEVGSIIAEATNQCRDWAAWSGDEAAPERYGERAAALARRHGLRVEVMDKARIEAMKMGGVLAVARGSVREPRVVVLSYEPRGAKGTIVLVGKGITFDSGGISIKPSERMEDMKFDKCGASAVMGAVVAAKRLKFPMRVIAIAPFTDNLPSGSSYKPGDIVTTMSGKTIEIVNTDAEGRVILSDALHYGGTLGPDAMVELSTLTGACPVAVGHHAIAGMGNSDDLLAQLRAAGDVVNERVWPLPFFDEYGEMVKSKIADVKNSAGRIASCITAGKFLENFVGDHPWVHLDIASTAYHNGSSPRLNDEYCPEQATGVGVRLLVQWMREYRKPAWKKKAKPDSGEPKADLTREPAKGPSRISVG